MVRNAPIIIVYLRCITDQPKQQDHITIEVTCPENCTYLDCRMESGCDPRCETGMNLVGLHILIPLVTLCCLARSHLQSYEGRSLQLSASTQYRYRMKNDRGLYSPVRSTTYAFNVDTDFNSPLNPLTGRRGSLAAMIASTEDRPSLDPDLDETEQDPPIVSTVPPDTVGQPDRPGIDRWTLDS